MIFVFLVSRLVSSHLISLHMRSHIAPYEISYRAIWGVKWGEMRLAKCDVEAQFATVGQRWAVTWQAPMTYGHYGTLDVPEWFLTVRNSRKSFWSHFGSNFADFPFQRQLFGTKNRRKNEVSEKKRFFLISLFHTRNVTQYELLSSRQFGVVIKCVDCFCFGKKNTVSWTERAGPLSFWNLRRST